MMNIHTKFGFNDNWSKDFFERRLKWMTTTDSSDDNTSHDPLS